MTFTDRSEAAMTVLLDTVAEALVTDEEWTQTSLYQKYVFKQGLLPMVQATIDALDAEAHRPMRGDEVEAWIKRKRDEHPKQDYEYTVRDGIDALLDDYRLHADTGTPLTSDVDEMGG